MIPGAGSLIFGLTIVSGGQTGADRAALDWAIAHGVACGGWCPNGRRAEDGPIPRRYRLRQTPSAEYPQRTDWNVRDSDATVIFTLTMRLSGGSRLTRDCARRRRKPCLHVARSEGVAQAARRLRDFIARCRVRILNVAGPRASQQPQIAAFVSEVLSRASAGERPPATAPVVTPRAARRSSGAPVPRG